MSAEGAYYLAMASCLVSRICAVVACFSFASCKGGNEIANEKAPVVHDNSLPSSVWLVEKDGKHLYLGGTIHLLRKEDHPLPKVFDRAYADSKKMVFELPPGSEGDAEAVKKMQALGMYLTEEGVDKHISNGTLKELRKWLKKNQLPFEAFQSMRPWMLALTIAATEYQRIGAQPAYGVDKHYEKLAKKDGKRTEGLETVDFQLGIFAGLTSELQEKLLLQTLSEVEAIGKDFEEMLEAWRKGDAEALQKFLFRDAEKYPDLMEAFLTKRNRAWVAPVMQCLENQDREGKAFVLVGAGHLGGENGLIDLLKKEGCKVTQLQ